MQQVGLIRVDHRRFSAGPYPHPDIRRTPNIEVMTMGKGIQGNMSESGEIPLQDSFGHGTEVGILR